MIHSTASAPATGRATKSTPKAIDSRPADNELQLALDFLAQADRGDDLEQTRRDGPHGNGDTCSVSAVIAGL